MQQDPTYLGHVPVPGGQPILFFSTGFLVQTHRDPARCGWYRQVNAAPLAANADASMVRTIMASDIGPAPMSMVMRAIRELADRQHGAAGAVNPAQVYVLMDVPHEDFYVPSPVYTFPGPFVRAGTPGPQGHVDAAHATRVAGPFDGTGQPLQARRLTPPTGLLRLD